MSYIDEKTLCSDCTTFFSVKSVMTQPSPFFLQVYADDVLTKEEQIGLLFRAKQKCESIIKAKHKIHGEQRQQRQFCVLLELNANKGQSSYSFELFLLQAIW